MITLCRIVLTVVSCTIDPTTPPPTPAEAVAIFAASLGPYRVPVPDVPFVPGWVYSTPSEPYDRNWPFTGTFAPTFAPAQRLDGTWLSEPPAIYGAPVGHGYRGYYGRPHQGGGYAGSGRPNRGTRDLAATPHAAPAPAPAPAPLVIDSRPVANPGTGGAVLRRRP